MESFDIETFDFEQATQQEEKWLNSDEGIMDNLLLHVDSQDLTTLIVMTVVDLPQEIKDFLYEECYFLSVSSGTYGTVLPPLPRWLIFLSDEILNLYNEYNEDNEDNGKSIIAHEIAHAWLQHNKMAQITVQCELQATKLAIRWGFKGKGADLAYVFERYPELRTKAPGR